MAEYIKNGSVWTFTSILRLLLRLFTFFAGAFTVSNCVNTALYGAEPIPEYGVVPLYGVTVTTVQGEIRNTNSSPIPGLDIKVIETSTQYTNQTTTDSNGTYTVFIYPSVNENIELMVEDPDGPSNTGAYKSTNISTNIAPGETKQIDITLEDQ